MQILIIDVLSLLFIFLNNENSKNFFFIELYKKLEDIAIIFTNRLFNYSFFIINNILLNYINPAKAINNIIDIDISKHFTKDYKQYLVYKKDIKDITIDISKVSTIHI